MRSKALAKRLPDHEPITTPSREHHSLTSRNPGRRTGSTSKPTELEVGKVLPDLVLMSNGILACSYGRPTSCLMFSLDGGKTWSSHHVISDKVGFNYTSIREISPGKLLYVHDAPAINGRMVEVEKAK